MMKYIKVELRRLFTGWEFYISCFGVCAVYLLGSYQASYSQSLFEHYFYIVRLTTTIAVFMFTTMSYVNSILDDEERKYRNLMIQRGNVKGYIHGKLTAICIGAMLTMVIGTILYAIVIGSIYPIVSEGDRELMSSIAQANIFGEILLSGNVILYIIISSLLRGTLAMIIALVSAIFVNIIKSRMFTIAVPVVVFYFYGLVIKNKYVDMHAIYLCEGKLFTYTYQNYMYVVAISLTAIILLLELNKLIMKRDIAGRKI